MTFNQVLSQGIDLLFSKIMLSGKMFCTASQCHKSDILFLFSIALLYNLTYSLALSSHEKFCAIAFLISCRR
jgi:hypothetical protein